MVSCCLIVFNWKSFTGRVRLQYELGCHLLQFHKSCWQALVFILSTQTLIMLSISASRPPENVALTTINATQLGVATGEQSHSVDYQLLRTATYIHIITFLAHSTFTDSKDFAHFALCPLMFLTLIV